MEILRVLGIEEINQGASTGLDWNTSKEAGELEVFSPVDGRLLAKVALATEEDYRNCVATARKAFISWRTVPPPKRGEVVRQIGDALRSKKVELGTLVSWEVGKSLQSNWRCFYALYSFVILLATAHADECSQHRGFDRTALGGRQLGRLGDRTDSCCA